MSIGNLLSRSVGMRLLDVAGTFYVPFESDLYSRSAPQEIYLDFGSHGFSVAGAEDGWRIILQQRELRELNMEQAGRIVVRSVADLSPFKDLVGKTVNLCFLLSSPPDDEPIGICLRFGDVNLFIANWGDELFIGRKLPPDAGPDEIRIKPI